MTIRGQTIINLLPGNPQSHSILSRRSHEYKLDFYCSIQAPPTFVNKYTNRSNGGIPIYAQERMQERAARRFLFIFDPIGEVVPTYTRWSAIVQGGASIVGEEPRPSLVKLSQR